MEKYLLCPYHPSDDAIKYYKQIGPNTWKGVDRFGNEVNRYENSDTMLHALFKGDLAILSGTPMFDEQYKYPRVFTKTVTNSKLYYILEKNWDLHYIEGIRYCNATMSGIKDVSVLGKEVIPEVRECVLSLRQAILLKENCRVN